ncbi:MAG: hypothetical protein FJX77_04705, partial [Armatimonadetes bacterium]|nr:hypothetical protein [Armatimonadota bacterium]
MSEPQESIGVRDLPAMTVTTPDRETEFGHEEPVSRFDAPGFDYDAATQPQPNRAYLPEPAAPGGAACAGHPGNAARIVCDRCGDFMCRLCATPVEGHTYCPACFTLLHSQGSLAFTQKSFTAPAVC